MSREASTPNPPNIPDTGTSAASPSGVEGRLTALRSALSNAFS